MSVARISVDKQVQALQLASPAVGGGSPTGLGNHPMTAAKHRNPEEIFLPRASGEAGHSVDVRLHDCYCHRCLGPLPSVSAELEATAAVVAGSAPVVVRLGAGAKSTAAATPARTAEARLELIPRADPLVSLA